MNTDKIIADILAREGWPTYSNEPADRGGPTKGGITLRSWREFTGNPFATVDDLKALTDAQGEAFYRHRHIISPNFDRIDDPYLRDLVVDCGVHHGVSRASKWLQRVVGTRRDGIVGDKTLSAVQAADARVLMLGIISHRIRLFGRLIGRDPELKRASKAGFHLQARWAGGWNNRAADFIDTLAKHL